MELTPGRDAKRVRNPELSATFERTADALERSAVLADQHAERAKREGRPDAAASERRVAHRAHEAARRARARADELR